MLKDKQEKSQLYHNVVEKNKTEFGDMRPEFKFTTITLEIQAEF